MAVALATAAAAALTAMVPITVIPITVTPITVIPITVIPISVTPITVIPISVTPITVTPITVIPIATTRWLPILSSRTRPGARSGCVACLRVALHSGQIQFSRDARVGGHDVVGVEDESSVCVRV